MAENMNDKRRISLMLVQESLWKVEDKLNVILESVADHEAELIRLRHLVNLITERIRALESCSKRSAAREDKNGPR